MPETFVTVYFRETGEPFHMHSVDAAEAVRIGDYMSEPLSGYNPTPEELANVAARARGIGTATHPELMTPEQRAEHRRLAAEAAALAARPVVMVTAAAPSMVGAEALASDAARMKAETEARQAAAQAQAKADADARAKAEAEAKAKADAAKK